MRILQVISFYPPALSFGGPPQVMFSLGRELARRGHSLSVYTTDALDSEDLKVRIGQQDDDIDGIKVHRFRRVRYSSMMPTHFFKFLVTGVEEQCLRELGSFDIIHITGFRRLLAIKCSSWADKMKVPYVISVFGDFGVLNNPLMQMLRKLFHYYGGQRIVKGASALLVQTPHEGTLCLPYNPDGKIVDMPLPVDLTAFSRLPRRGIFRQKYGINKAEGIILFLGRIHRYKGIPLLVETFAELLKKGQNYRLVIAGADVGYKTSLVKLIKELRIAEMVTFTGPIFGEDKLEAYVDADVFVTTPIVYEETSLAALEACACHTPVIINEHNAIPGLEEYEAGYQIRRGKKELESTLLRILSDSASREKMGQNARRLIEERYRLELVADRLEKLFLEIILGKVTQAVVMKQEGNQQ